MCRKYAGYLFFLALLALEKYTGKEANPGNIAAPDRIEVQETEELTKDSGNYHSPVPFERFWKVNPDIIGWISIDGTNINYPVVQAEDNTKYLTASYDGTENPAGAVFLDYDCEQDFLGKHNIIYGHNMKDGSMFHDLVNFKKESYYRNHQIITVYTPGKEIHLRPVAVVCTEADGIRRRTDFFDMTAFDEYVETMLEGGLYKEEQESDITRLWSFVTCSYEFDNARTILYARECGP